MDDKPDNSTAVQKRIRAEKGRRGYPLDFKQRVVRAVREMEQSSIGGESPVGSASRKFGVPYQTVRSWIAADNKKDIKRMAAVDDRKAEDGVYDIRTVVPDITKTLSERLIAAGSDETWLVDLVALEMQRLYTENDRLKA